MAIEVVAGVQVVGSESPKLVPLTVWFVQKLKAFFPEPAVPAAKSSSLSCVRGGLNI